jgi:putative FmdB family regulatory protein
MRSEIRSSLVIPHHSNLEVEKEIMPLYEYECTACHKHTEKIQKFSDPEITVCPHCGGKLERVISAPAVSFKGGGWYADGYGNAKPKSSGDSKTESKSSNDSKSTPSNSTSDSGSSSTKESSPAPAPAAPAVTSAPSKKD